MAQRSLTLALCLALGAFALATGPSAQITVNPIEKITLKGKRGPKLLQPGFQIGEYDGFYSAMNKNTQFFGSKDSAKTSFQLQAPSLPTPITATCEGGQSKLVIAGITWKRSELAYNCTYGGGAPADAVLTLVLGDGTFMQRLQQPQRAGELRWNGQTIRFDTRQVGGMPISGGKPLGYVFTRAGREIGAVDLGGGLSPPAFFVQPKGSPDRDAVMVAALSLFVFPDPGGSR